MLYMLSVPLLLISLIMIILFLIFFFDNFAYSCDSYVRATIYFTSQYIFIAAFDIISIIRMSQSLAIYGRSEIKSYQYRLKAFINLYIMFIFCTIACIVLSVEELADNIATSVIVFVIFIFIPLILVTWRFNKNRDTLRELVIADLKSKRGM